MMKTYFQEKRRTFQGKSYCKHCKEVTVHDVSGTKAKCHQCGKGGKMKMNNSSQEYNGRLYQSMLEANYAAELDIRVKIGEVKSWKPQVKYELKVGGYHIVNHYVDFVLEMPDGTIELHECKGQETDLWKMKRNLLLATVVDPDPGISYKVIK